jgi:hypothetical protein
LKKGAQTGNLIHYLLEHINFAEDANWNYLIEKSLKRMGVKGNEQLVSQFRLLLQELVSTSIVAEDTFCLQQVKNEKRINELEFDFPLKPFATKQLAQLSNPELPFKIKSIQELEKLPLYGIDYVQHINKRYTDTPPKEFCARPWNVGGIVSYSLKGPHYGNYQSFKKVFEEKGGFVYVLVHRFRRSKIIGDFIGL